MKAIYTFYSLSPKRSRELNKVAENDNQQHTVTYQRLDGTRWVAHHKHALQAFLHNFPFLLTHLEEVCSPHRKDIKSATQQTMKGWLKKMTNTTFILACNFYLDVLTELTVISETFQRYIQYLLKMHNNNNNNNNKNNNVKIYIVLLP